MTGVIIAGGAGVRLRPLSYVRPKPMMPIANKPLLQYQTELMKRHGVSNIVFSIRENADHIERYFGDGNEFGLNITHSIEDRPLGTGGAVRFSEPYWQDDYAIVTNGDGIIDYDLSEIARFHIQTGADATIGLMQVPSPTHCGIVAADAEGRVTSFDEPGEKAKKLHIGKPEETTGMVTVNAGVYVIARSAIKTIPLGEKNSIEKEFFPTLIKNGMKVYGLSLNGYWKDIGGPQNYLQAHHDLLSGKINAQIIGAQTNNGYWVNGEVNIHPSADISAGAHLGGSCAICADAIVKNHSSIGSNAVIGEGSVIDGCVILENVVIGAGCMLKNCIVDRDCDIGDGIRITDGSVVGANSRLKSVL